MNAFFGPKILVFGQKIQFLPYDPNFGQRPVCSPRRDGLFPTLVTIFNFSFPSYGRFPKKIWPTLQKVFPLPTLRAPSASNSPSALSARLDKSSGWRPQLQYRCIHATGSFNLCVCVSAGNRFKFCCQASTKYQEAVSNYPLIITFFFVLIVEQDKIQEQFEKYPHDD